MKGRASVLQIQEIQEIVEVGITMPVRCILENGISAIVKYMRNPFGQQVLINEYIGAKIAEEIGLSIPEYGICYMSRQVILDTNFNEELDENNYGYGFFSKIYSKTVPPTRNFLSEVVNKETEKVILFDHVVNNCDRHKGNLLIQLNETCRLYFIDNSHIVIDRENDGIDLTREGILSHKVMQNNECVYELLCSGIGYSEERVRLEVQRIKQKVSDRFLDNILCEIPDEWTESIENGKIELMLECIKKRVALLEDISEMIIKERRNR